MLQPTVPVLNVLSFCQLLSKIITATHLLPIYSIALVSHALCSVLGTAGQVGTSRKMGLFLHLVIHCIDVPVLT